jgi:hypothetical protein
MGGSMVFFEQAEAIQTLWEVQLDKDLQGRVYEAAILPGKSTVVITSPEAVWQIESGGKPIPLLTLERKGSEGESAILAAEGGHVGIFTHNYHDIKGFELIDLETGKPLGQLKDDPRHFHYRLAPDGSSFVGIDAGEKHVPAKAKAFIYRFFDAKGTPVGKEIESPSPQPTDSAYAPDGQAFLINNAKGLSAYNPADLKQRWTINKAIKFFAPANGTLTYAVIADANKRNIAELYQTGRLKWSLTLKNNVRNVAITPSGKFIAVSDATILHILAPDNGKPLASFEVDRGLAINSIAVSDLGIVAIGAQDSSLKSGQVFLLDTTGKELFNDDTQHERSNAWIPMVQFDASGEFLLIRTLEEIRLLSVK